MKKLLILFLLLTVSASAQFAMVGAWQSVAVGKADSVVTNIDSLKGYYVAKDLADSLGKADGDTTYILKNRARWIKPYALADLFQTTDAAKPVYESDSTSLLFDGVDDFMRESGLVSYAPPYTVVMVMSYAAADAVDLYYSSAATNAAGGYHNAAAAGYQLAMSSGTDQNTNRNARDSLRTHFFVHDGASSYVVANTNRSANVSIGTNAIIGLTLAGNRSGATLLAGRLRFREMLVIHSALSEDLYSRLKAYYTTKYGAP